MSGSPVVAKRVGAFSTSTGYGIGTGSVHRFLGVYSGRINVNIDASIGIVWKPNVFEEIFAHAGL